MEELKRLQRQATQLDAIAWLFKLVGAVINIIGAVLSGIFAMFTGCIGFAAILLASAPLIFFCLLFVVIAAAIH